MYSSSLPIFMNLNLIAILSFSFLFTVQQGLIHLRDMLGNDRPKSDEKGSEILLSLENLLQTILSPLLHYIKLIHIYMLIYDL